MVLLETTQIVVVGEKNKQVGVGQDWVWFDVEKESKMRFFGHITRKDIIEKRLIRGKVRGRSQLSTFMKAYTAYAF